MALTLADVLASPALQHSRPLLLAGDPATRTVRWVHSSEIYDIARLLRGGELLLTTGLGLERSSDEQRRAYVRALAAKQIAGLALELSDSFSQVPEDMIDEARRLDLPFIVLRDVYPFVEVTEQVNSAILDSSITRLRHADEVGRALSLVLAERGGLDLLTSTLADLVGRPVVLVDSTGAVLAAAADEPQEVLDAPAATGTVTADGILLAGLVIGPGTSGDDLLQAAVERAPEIFALAVLRDRQRPLLSGRDRRDLLARLLTPGAEDPLALEAHAGASGIPHDARWSGLAIGATERGRGLALAQDVARRTGLRLMAAEVEDTTYALVAVLGSDQHAAMEAVRTALGSVATPVTAVGPVQPASSAGRSLRSAAQVLTLGVDDPAGRRPLVAADLVVERLLAAVGDRRHLADLVEEQLGSLLHAARAETLLRTLEAYLDSGCSKAATARMLHLRRQSVHQRLTRITALLDRDLADPRQQTALRLALAARRLS